MRKACQRDVMLNAPNLSVFELLNNAQAVELAANHDTVVSNRWRHQFLTLVLIRVKQSEMHQSEISIFCRYCATNAFQPSSFCSKSLKLAAESGSPCTTATFFGVPGHALHQRKSSSRSACALKPEISSTLHRTFISSPKSRIWSAPLLSHAPRPPGG